MASNGEKEGEGDRMWAGDKEVKRYKVLCIKLAARIYCITGIIANILNYKWSITFKHCESLYCTHVTYNILHQL